MGSIMLLILINLICIGNNEGIPNELQADSSRSIPCEERSDPLIAGHVAKQGLALPSQGGWADERNGAEKGGDDGGISLVLTIPEAHWLVPGCDSALLGFLHLR